MAKATKKTQSAPPSRKKLPSPVQSAPKRVTRTEAPAKAAGKRGAAPSKLDRSAAQAALRAGVDRSVGKGAAGKVAPAAPPRPALIPMPPLVPTGDAAQDAADRRAREIEVRLKSRGIRDATVKAKKVSGGYRLVIEVPIDAGDRIAPR